MKKFILPLLIAAVILAQPLAASAGCCKIINYSSVDLPLLDDEPYSRVEDLKNAQECLDTCSGWRWQNLLEIYLVSRLGAPAAAVRLANYHCQNFYYPDAKPRSFDGACVEEKTQGCCQVTIKDVGYYSYASNYQGEAYNKSECALYCMARSDCNSEFKANHDPNRETGMCQPINKDESGAITDPSEPSFQIEDYNFTIPTDPLKYAAYSPARVLAKVINGLLLILGTIALIMFIYAGVLWMTDRGGGSNIKKARSILVWSTAGLVLIFVSYIAVGYLLETFSAI
jgi:hypothetical protein